MKLAIQDNLVPGKTFSEKLSNMEKYGFQGVEVEGGEILEKLEEIKSALSTSRIKFSTVCGAPGILLGPDRKTREETMKGIMERLKACADLDGVGVITVPLFGGPKIPDLYPWQPDVKEVENKILIEECKILGNYAEDIGSIVILEPLNRYETHLINRLEQAVEICEAVGKDHVKIMGDFFHMSIEEQDIASSLERTSDYTVHIHLADSNRLLPGQGHTDFEKSFKVLKNTGYKNFMAMECGVPGDPNEALPKSIKYLKQFM